MDIEPSENVPTPDVPIPDVPTPMDIVPSEDVQVPDPVFCIKLGMWINKYVPFVMPYTPHDGEICGRCQGTKRSAVVAVAVLPGRWEIVVCKRCLTPMEKNELGNTVNDTVMDVCYICGLA